MCLAMDCDGGHVSRRLVLTRPFPFVSTASCVVPVLVDLACVLACVGVWLPAVWSAPHDDLPGGAVCVDSHSFPCHAQECKKKAIAARNLRNNGGKPQTFFNS